MSPQNKPTPSPILYQNQPQTIFLLDIPTSIEKAQTLSTVNHNHNHNHTNQLPSPSTHLLSTTPPQTPYNKSGSGSKNTEPKTAAARERVLARIPEKERTYHERVIEPVVCDAIKVIQEEYHYRVGFGEWCLPRCVVGERGVVEGLDRGDGDDFRLSTTQYDDDDDDPVPEPGSGSRSRPTSDQPPVILSPTSINEFPSITTELINQPVKNTSPEPAILRSTQNRNQTHPETFIIPPLANFILCTIPTTQMSKQTKTNYPAPIPGLEGKRFNLILLDPPWSNRSVRRATVYQTNRYFDVDDLTRRIGDILRVHLYGDPGTGTDDGAQNQTGIAAIWVTNSSKSRNAAYNALQSVGLSVVEEWVWIKTTTQGEPITPVDGIWRKPYEILVIGRRQAATITAGEDSAVHGGDGDPGRTITRRVIAAVPDVHSRKPNLKELFERVFFTAHSSLDRESTARMSYSALEVFARNLTAGWWACGDEVLKFNEQRWWTQAAR